MSLSVLLCLALALLGAAAQSVDPPSTALQNGVPVSGSAALNSTAFFAFTNPTAGQTVLISVAPDFGFPTLYVSPTVQFPTAATAQWSSIAANGAVVSVPSAAAGAYYIAVVASSLSASNFTVVAVSYDPSVLQSTTIPLTDAQPQSSALAGGEYRYYTFSVGSGVSSFSVSNLQRLGSTTIVVNGPGSSSGLPTLAACQFSSAQSLVGAVTVNASSPGSYTIGVYADSDALFTILAALLSSVVPMTYGTLYGGSLLQGQQQVYSAYIDPAQLPSSGQLSFALYTLSGRPVLYCSNATSSPGPASSQYPSVVVAALSAVYVPGRLLAPGPFYCGVYGFIPSVYTLSASLLGTGQTITGQDVVYVQSNEGDRNAFTYYVLTADVVLASSIVINVVADYGTVQLTADIYTVPAGRLGGGLGSTAASSTALLRVPFSSNWCNNSRIAGSDPPQCGVSVVVYSVTGALYRIAISGAGADEALLVGQPLLGDVTPQSSSGYSFSVPNNFINVTVTVSMTSGGASGLTLYGSVVGYPGTRWVIAQNGADPVLVWQIDWTDPLLPVASYIQGRYTIVLSASVETTYTIVLTFANGTAYNGAAKQLITGTPQYDVLVAGQYNFYTYTPPLTGWPYTVLFTATFYSGTGSILVRPGTPSTPLGPVSGQATWLGSSSIQINPPTGASTAVCNPNVTTSTLEPCLYQVSVLGARGSAPLEYAITAAVSGYSRALNTGGMWSSAMVPGVIDYYVWQWLAQSAYHALLTVEVQTGQLLLFLSNTTAQPNATTALQTIPVSALALVPLDPASYLTSLAWIAVTCLSPPCLYQLTTTGYSSTDPLRALSSAGFGNSRQQALQGGDMYWFSSAVSNPYSSVGVVLFQVQPTVGAVAFYVSAAPGPALPVWPNETYSLWSSTTAGQTVLEVVPTSTQRVFLVGVRALGGEAFFTYSASLGGVSADLSQAYSLQGVLQPSYPVSYFRYELTNPSPLIVLSFLVSTADCPASIQLWISDTDSAPSPSSSNWSSTPGVTLADGTYDVSVALTNTSLPPGSLHLGVYYIAVQAAAPLTAPCTFTVIATGTGQRMLVDQAVIAQSIGNSARAFFSFVMQPNTAVSFQFSNFLGRASPFQLYVGVGTSPVSGDSSTFLLSRTYNLSTSGGPLAAPIFLPASTCTAVTPGFTGCLVTFMGACSGYADVNVLTTSSYNLSALTAGAAAATGTTLFNPSYKNFALPAPQAGPQAVTVAVVSAVPVALYCSWRFVRPTSIWQDWWAVYNVSVPAINATGATYGGQLTFSWNDSLLLNAQSAIAQTASTCWCSVIGLNRTAPASLFSISYSVAQLPQSPSTSSSSSLSSGALAAAIVVPIITCLLIVCAVVFAVRRSQEDHSCCSWGMQEKSGGSGLFKREQSDERPSTEMEYFDSRSANAGRSFSRFS